MAPAVDPRLLLQRQKTVEALQSNPTALNAIRKAQQKGHESFSKKHGGGSEGSSTQHESLALDKDETSTPVSAASALSVLVAARPLVLREGRELSSTLCTTRVAADTVVDAPVSYTHLTLPTILRV